MPTHQEILNELSTHFDKVKALMDKYPNAIEILWTKDTGYFFVVDIDLLDVAQKNIDGKS